MAPAADEPEEPHPKELPDFRLGWNILRQRLRTDRTTQQAAAMTYNTLFSLLPILVLGMVILSLVLTSAQIASTEHSLASKLGLSAMHNRGATTQNASLFVNTILKQIDKMRRVLRSPGTGIVGFATLLWGAISLMSVIEGAFDHIYRVRNRRSWARRVTLYWCVLSLGPLGIVGSLFITAKFVSIAAMVPRLALIMGPVNFLVGYLPDFIIIFIFYKLIPNTMVRWKSAAIGALVATLMWEVGKIGFGLYVAYVAGYGKWYGNLGLIPLFMLWVFLTWTFMLIGLEVAYIHQHFPLLKRRLSRHSDITDFLADPRWILPLAALLVAKFRLGQTVTLDAAAEELALPLETTQRLFGIMTGANLAHESGENPPVFILGKSPDAIKISELLTLAHLCIQTPTDSHRGSSALLGSIADSPLILELRQLENTWASEHTLADLIPPTLQTPPRDAPRESDAPAPPLAAGHAV